MTDEEMLEASFNRPSDYWQKSLEERLRIDTLLGIETWSGELPADPEIQIRFMNHYKTK